MEEENLCDVRNEEHLLIEEDKLEEIVRDENGELPTEITKDKLEKVRNELLVNIEKTNLGIKEVNVLRSILQNFKNMHKNDRNSGDKGESKKKKDKKPTEKSDLSITETVPKLNLCKTKDDTNFAKTIEIKQVISENKEETMKESKSEKNPLNELEEIENSHNTQLEERVERSNFAKMAIKDKEVPSLVLKKVVYVSPPDTYSRKKFRKRKNMWASGIIQKKMRKGNWSIKMDGTENQKDNEEFELTDYVEHDKNYFFEHLAEICCKFCSFKGKLIVQHYRMSHPESEVLISRLNPDITEILIGDAMRNHEEYEKNHSELEKMACNFKCPFCLMLIKDTTNTYYNHISSHTGEYCFHCNHCSYWTYSHTNIHSHLNQKHYKIEKTDYKMAYLGPKVSNYVFGYICQECNFIQLIRKTVEEHAMVYHTGMPKIHKVNLGVLLYDDVLDENGTNEVHSNENCLNLNNFINHSGKIPAKTEELSNTSVQKEELEKDKVKIEPKKLDSHLCPIELTVFICETNLENGKMGRNKKRENKQPKNMSGKAEKLNEEVDPSEQPEKAHKSVEILEIGPISVVKEFNVFMFHCKIQNCNYSSEDKKTFATHCEVIHKDCFYNFGIGECNVCSIKFEYKGKFVTVYDVYLHIVTIHKDFFEPKSAINFKLTDDILNVLSPTYDNSGSEFSFIISNLRKSQTEDKEEALNSKVKFPVITSVQSLTSKTKQLVSASEDDSTCIPMSDTEHQNRKCPKAVAILMKPPLLNALYKCPKYDCSFATTLPVSFREHFVTHQSTLMDTLVPCLYCDNKVACGSYVVHLEVRHGHCLFGCGDCFYRTTNSYFITMHRELMHPNTEFNILHPLEVVTSNRISADTTPVNLSELVPPYICKEDGFLNCPFKTLYFEEYLKHMEVIHRVDGLNSFSFEQEPQKETVMEVWLAKEVGPFQCGYCKKATVTHEEMGRHQAVFHSQEQCLFYYRKFVPNDTVVIPEQVNLEDPSFINHVIHLPDQIHLCNFKLTDALLSSTSVKLTNEKSEVPLPVLPPAEDTETDSDHLSVSVDEPEAFSEVVNDETYLFEKADSPCLNEQPKDSSSHNNAKVTASKLQCKWKDCCETLHSRTSLIKHIEKDHIQLQSDEEFTCFWSNCPRKAKPFTSKAYLLTHMKIHTGKRSRKYPGYNKAFLQSEDLKVHKGKHKREGPYLCQFSNCSKSFFTSSMRNDHSRHCSREVYVCQVSNCPKKYEKPETLQLHMKYHTLEEQLEAKQKKQKSSKTLQCKWDGCFQTHHSQTMLVKHIETSHVQIKTPNKEYACFWINCRRKLTPFATRQCLSIHMRVHSGEKPYKCSSCNIAFSQSGSLKAHQITHRGEKPYLCQFRNCSKSFFDSSKAAEHQKLHRDTCKWKDCYQNLHSQTALIKHVRNNHVQLQSEEFTCFWDDCQRELKTFTYKPNLIRHVKVHTGEKPHKCSVCNKTFSQREHLRCHQKRHAGKRPYLCQFPNCSKGFSASSTRNSHENHYNRCKWKGCNRQSYDCQTALIKHIEKNHVELETGRNRFTCFWIGCLRNLKPYSRTQNLMIHVRSHIAEKPYKCRFQGCNKRFSLRRSLKSHQRKHTDERSFLCQFSSCFKSFSTVDERDYHQAMHYNIVYACQVTGCSEKYADPSSLQKHAENHTFNDRLEVKQKSVEHELKENDFIIYDL